MIELFKQNIKKMNVNHQKETNLSGKRTICGTRQIIQGMKDWLNM